MNNLRQQTLAVRAGHRIDPGSGAVVTPITMSVTFERAPDVRHEGDYHYASAGNPNRAALEAGLAAIEGGHAAVALSSGHAAIASVLRTLNPGDHVLVPQDVFQGTMRLLTQVLPKWGISHDVVDMTSLDAVRAAFTPDTRLVWTETLSNPLLRVTDIAAVAELAHSHGAALAVDNSFVTPIFQRPLASGADYVVHASTKYFGGHADVMGGAVIAGRPSPAFDDIQIRRWYEGAVPSPFDCWLIHRGLKTLTCRMSTHAASAERIARFLDGHPAVDQVHYPGLESHPQHELAGRQLSGYGGLLSFQVHGGRQAALEVVSRAGLFVRATSFGCPESLIQHQASAPTHGTGTGLAENLLRLSVGLEHPDDLIADLDQALGGDPAS